MAKNLGSSLIWELIKCTYKLIAKLKKVPKSIAIIDTTSFKRSRASSHYEDQIGHKKMYAKVIAICGLDVNAVFMVGADYDAMRNVRIAEEILNRIADSRFLMDSLVTRALAPQSS